MKRGTPVVVLLILGLSLVLVAGIYSQVKKDEKTGLDRISGNIQAVNKDKSTLTVVQGGSTQKPSWKVAYNEKTVFTMQNAPAKKDDLKEGQRVIILGKFENDMMTATRIDIREK